MTTYKIKLNRNGNKVCVVKVSGERGFSIQTNGSLIQTHHTGVGHWTSGEVSDYVKRYGTKRQKELLGL